MFLFQDIYCDRQLSSNLVKGELCSHIQWRCRILVPLGWLAWQWFLKIIICKKMSTPSAIWHEKHLILLAFQQMSQTCMFLLHKIQCNWHTLAHVELFGYIVRITFVHLIIQISHTIIVFTFYSPQQNPICQQIIRTFHDKLFSCHDRQKRICADLSLHICILKALTFGVMGEIMGYVIPTQLLSPTGQAFI